MRDGKFFVIIRGAVYRVDRDGDRTNDPETLELPVSPGRGWREYLTRKLARVATVDPLELELVNSENAPRWAKSFLGDLELALNRQGFYIEGGPRA